MSKMNDFCYFSRMKRLDNRDVHLIRPQLFAKFFFFKNESTDTWNQRSTF